jgi:hypothetical protein
MSDETTTQQDAPHLTYEQTMGTHALAEQIAISALVLATNSNTLLASDTSRQDALRTYLEMIKQNSTIGLQHWPDEIATVAVDRLGDVLKMVEGAAKATIEAANPKAGQPEAPTEPEQPAQRTQQFKPIPLDSVQAIGRQLVTEELLLRTMFLVLDRVTFERSIDERREVGRQLINY